MRYYRAMLTLFNTSQFSICVIHIARLHIIRTFYDTESLFRIQVLRSELLSVQ